MTNPLLLWILSMAFALRAPPLYAKSRDERMAEFYKEKFSESAAQSYLARRERDKRKYSTERAKKLGAKDGEEYDLDVALGANTDDTIAKIIVAALLLAVSAGLYVGVLAPLLDPPSFTGDDGLRYVLDPASGLFIEK